MRYGQRSNSKSFVIWNNKGGVGKSTLLYFMSLNYARKNPKKTVLIIDMCPQADISATFLTSEKLERAQNDVIRGCYPKTIAGYLSFVTYPRGKIRFRDWLIWPSDYNSNVPDNIRLICGDNLDYLAKELDYKVNAPKSAEIEDPWKFVLLSLRKLVDKVKKENDWIIFIDTNPAFSIYTEIALIAGDFLMIPINADNFSYRALLNVFKLVYGQQQGKNSKLINFSKEEHFSEKIKKKKMKLPRLCSIILVGGNTYETRSALAFKAFTDEALKDSFEFYKQNTEIFVPLAEKIDDVKQFEKNYIDQFFKINSVGVLSIGKNVLPIDLNLTENLNGKNILTTNDQKDKLQAQIDKLTEKLDKWISPEFDDFPIKTNTMSNLPVTQPVQCNPVSNGTNNVQQNNETVIEIIDCELEAKKNEKPIDINNSQPIQYNNYNRNYNTYPTQRSNEQTNVFSWTNSNPRSRSPLRNSTWNSRPNMRYQNRPHWREMQRNFSNNSTNNVQR